MSLQPMIRDVRPEEAARLAELWIEFGAYYEAIDPDEFQTPRGADLIEWMEDDISGDRSDDELWVVADRDGSPVGYIRAQLLRPQDHAERHVLRTVGVATLKVDGLMVTETGRRDGIATALMRHAEAWAAGRGATEASVISYAESPTATPFYERRMGYVAKTTGYWKSLLPSG